LGYIGGIPDAMIDERIIGKGAAIRACTAKDVRAGDWTAKVIMWLANWTDRLSGPAAGLAPWPILTLTHVSGFILTRPECKFIYILKH